MEKVLQLSLFLVNPQHEHDFIDRLNCRTTPMILVIVSIFVFAKDFGLKPIECWPASEWPKSWNEYAREICFVENTYFVPMEFGIKRIHNEHYKAQLTYYQWVTFIFIFQALCFLFPLFFWQYCHWFFSGIRLRAILSMINEVRSSGNFITNEQRQNIAYHIQKSLKKKKTYLSKMSLSLIYCFSKFLYFINSLFQIYFLNVFISSDKSFFGILMLWGNIKKSKMWKTNGLFPRVTMCDFSIRSVTGGGQIENKSIQCVLPGNLINEKIFIALSVWYLILNGLTAINLLRWFFRLFFVNNRKKILEKLLEPFATDTFYIVTPIDWVNFRKIIPPSKNSYEDFIKLEAFIKNGVPEKLINDIISSASDYQDSQENSDDTDNDLESEATCVEDLSSNLTTKIDNFLLRKQKKDLAIEDFLIKIKKEKIEKSLRQILKRYQLEQKLKNYFNEICDFLGPDGVLIFELIRFNSYDLIATAILIQIIDDSFSPFQTNQQTKEIKEKNNSFANNPSVNSLSNNTYEKKQKPDVCY